MLFIKKRFLDEKIGLSKIALKRYFDAYARNYQKKLFRKKKLFSFDEAVEYLTIFSGNEELSKRIVNEIFKKFHLVDFDYYTPNLKLYGNFEQTDSDLTQ